MKLVRVYRQTNNELEFIGKMPYNKAVKFVNEENLYDIFHYFIVE